MKRLYATLDTGIPVPGPPGLPRVIYDEGIALPVRTIINMTGAGVTAADDAANDQTVITIPGHTPWTQDTNAADHSLLDVTSVVFSDGTTQTTAAISELTYSAAGADPHVILPRQPEINFSGAGVVVSDNPAQQRTEVFIPGAGVPDWADITGKPSTFPPDPHTHAWVDITSKPSTFPPDPHTHDYASITGKPSSFPPSSHAHVVAEVTGAVPDTRQVIAGTGLTGGGALSGNVTLNANIAGIQSPWTGTIDGAGKVLSNAGRIGVGNDASPISAVSAYTNIIVGSKTDRVALGSVMLCSNTSVQPDTCGQLSGANYNLAAADKRVAAVNINAEGSPDSGHIVFYTWHLGGAGERMRINSAGYVGIGNNNPGARLQVSHDDYRQLYLTGASDTTKVMKLGYDMSNNTGALEVRAGAAPVALAVQATGGNVLIGTTSDDTVNRLQVAGAFKGTGDVVFSGLTTAVPAAGSKKLYHDASGFVKIAI